MIPISYHFFAANLLCFYAVLRFTGSAAEVWTGRAFFVWTTVFALFNTSIFWCLMADVFRSDQAKRMFVFIGVGGTLGSIVGSMATAALAERIGAVNLLLVSAALLQMAVFTVVRFPLQTRERGGDDGDDVIGGSLWAGFTQVARSPYLLGICAFLILYTIGSTILYFAQSDIVGRTYADTTARTAILAKLELAAQVLTVITQVFFTGRIIRWMGLAVTLALLPAMSILGFGALGAVPTFGTLRFSRCCDRPATSR